MRSYAESTLAICEYGTECEHCGREIKKGQHYSHTSGVDEDGEYYNLIMCRKCGQLFSYVAGETGDIVTSDDVSEFVKDHICCDCRLHLDCQKNVCARIMRVVNA